MDADLTSDGEIDTFILGDIKKGGNATFLFDLDQDSNLKAVEDAELLAELKSAWDVEFAVSDSTQRLRIL
jgi:hypothetical protein